MRDDNMRLYEIVLIAIGLSMDAFAVSICKGLSMQKMNYKNAIIIALYFAIFQGLMPIIGFFLGTTFRVFVERVDHWIAFILLLIIGINMIVEGLDNAKPKNSDLLDFKTMIILSLATSIDALAVGITFAFFRTNLLSSTIIIASITFVLSIIGVKIGNRFGDKLQGKAKIIGGIVLIIIGIKILIEHLGMIRF